MTNKDAQGRAEMHVASSGERGPNSRASRRGASNVPATTIVDLGLRIRRSGSGGRTREQHLDSWGSRHNGNAFGMRREPPWYGAVCPVVWEDGGSNPAPYPIVARFQRT